jgi:hypothetical protein
MSFAPCVPFHFDRRAALASEASARAATGFAESAELVEDPDADAVVDRSLVAAEYG